PARRSCRRRARSASVLWRQLVGRQHQALDPSAILQMRLDDLVDVLRVLVAVPDALGIDDHVGAVFAAVEAARRIAADILDPQLPRLLAHIAAQFFDPTRLGGARRARTARMTLRPRIGADKDVAVVK